MLANINIAGGVTALITAIVGGGIFLFTVFSVNAWIIGGGLVLTALFALWLFVNLYRSIARTTPKKYGPAGLNVLGLAHILLFVANLIVLLAIPSLWGLLFDPTMIEGFPDISAAAFPALVASSILSLGIWVDRNRKSNATT